MLTSWSRYLAELVQLGNAAYDGDSTMCGADGFISSWHGKHVNVLELPGSFESMLMHFGWKPSAASAGLHPGFGAQFHLFSYSDKRDYTTVVKYFFFFLNPERNVGVKITCFFGFLSSFSLMFTLIEGVSNSSFISLQIR